MSSNPQTVMPQMGSAPGDAAGAGSGRFKPIDPLRL